MWYLFANCALYNIPLKKEEIYAGRPLKNFRTEGILRLLNGESLTLHADDKEILFASPKWEKLRLAQLKGWPHFHLKGCYEFRSMTPTADDIFLWTPFGDCLCSYTEARCEDGSPFPSMEGCVSEVFPHLPRIEFERVLQSWENLIQRLSHVDDSHAVGKRSSAGSHESCLAV